jgi:uncharacterized DUF497 family protein
MGSDDPHQAAAVGAGKCGSGFDRGREAAEVGLEQPLDEPDQRSFLQLRQTAAQAAIAADTFCIYTLAMEFTWSARKRSLNLKEHGLDFVDAITVFQGLTFTFEDDRFSYKEQRFVTLGLLAGTPVSVVHTETAHEIRIISFRKATHREAQIYFSQIQN